MLNVLLLIKTLRENVLTMPTVDLKRRAVNLLDSYGATIIHYCFQYQKRKRIGMTNHKHCRETDDSTKSRRKNSVSPQSRSLERTIRSSPRTYRYMREAHKSKSGCVDGDRASVKFRKEQSKGSSEDQHHQSRRSSCRDKDSSSNKKVEELYRTKRPKDDEVSNRSSRYRYRESSDEVASTRKGSRNNVNRDESVTTYPKESKEKRDEPSSFGSSSIDEEDRSSGSSRRGSASNHRKGRKSTGDGRKRTTNEKQSHNKKDDDDPSSDGSSGDDDDCSSKRSEASRRKDSQKSKHKGNHVAANRLADKKQTRIKPEQWIKPKKFNGRGS